MLAKVLMYLKNWFLVEKWQGEVVVQDGSVELPFLQNGQYFRIFGSVFNDGLHQYPANDLQDESFDGVIWALAIPKEVIELSAEIEEWQKKNSNASTSPYQSESFGGYSYTKATDENGEAITWQKAFKSELNPWKKVREV